MQTHGDLSNRTFSALREECNLQTINSRFYFLHVDGSVGLDECFLFLIYTLSFISKSTQSYVRLIPSITLKPWPG